jgi:hypothetical protein
MALLCKSSRDEDSRKLILSVVLDQGLAKKAQKTKGIVMQIGRIYTETEPWVTKEVIRKGQEEKGNGKKTD